MNMMDIIEDQVEIKQEFVPDVDGTEFVIETVKLPTKPTVQTRSIAIWSNEETKKLIDLYRKFLTDIGPYNRFKRKKDMWSEISAHIGTKSAKQCEERLKTVRKRKKKGIIEKVYLSNTKRKVRDSDAEEENELSIIRKQKLSSKSDECITTCKSIQIWSNNETKLLVELYKNFINDVGPQKRFKSKKNMWNQISANFEDKDPRQCEQRFNTILRRKKPNTTKAYITKARRKTVDYRPRQMEINIKKSNIVDEVEADINEVEDDINGVEEDTNKTNTAEDEIVLEEMVKPQIKEECIDQLMTTAAKTEIDEAFSICETLEKIAAKKEEGKERRHRERMEALAKMQFILQQVIIATKK